MSLASPMPSAGRPLQEQSLSLVAFLAARDNILTASQAASALDGLPDDEKEGFCKTLNTLYLKSKEERRAGFLHVAQRVKEKEAQNEDK